MSFRFRAVTMAAAVGLAVQTWLAASAGGLSQAALDLSAYYPGVQFELDQGRVRVIYGAPMTPAATAQDAADAFLAQHVEAFGVEGLTVEQIWSADIRDGKFTVFAYRQTVSGMPVEGTVGRVLVLNEPLPQVVYAAGLFAPLPAGGFPTELVGTERALARVQNSPVYGDLANWTQPELAFWQNYDAATSVAMAWKFVGDSGDPLNPRKFTFFVDAASGQLLEARNEIHYTDVSGKVQAMATPGTLPDIASNPPVATAVPRIRVTITGGGNAYTDLAGNYLIANPGTTQVTVNTKLGEVSGDGQWVHVNDSPGTAQALSSPVTPPGPGDFMFNATPSANVTAQANAFIVTTLTHNYIKDRAPTFNGLDTSLRANVNLAQTCNAFFDGSSINFYAAGGGCVNTSYSSVISHEYGHFIVQQLGLAQGAFGEGYGDTVGMLLYDDWIVGKNFFTTGGYIRDPNNANKQYPCSGEIHDCGQLLAGVWWDIRKNFGVTYGQQTGLAETQQLQVDWSLITTGGSGTNSAHPATAIEVLTVDDNDGNLNNGTPNYNDICPAFSKHNIQCPPLKLIKFAYPNGLPTKVTPDAQTTIDVQVLPDLGTPKPGSGKVGYSVNGAPFTKIAMTEVTPNNYKATLPAVACGGTVRFYFEAADVGGVVNTDPADAPTGSYSALSGTSVTNVFADDFETNKGWTYGVPGDDATTGMWNRMPPQSTGAQPGSDHTPGAGTQCAVTDGNAGSSIGAFDVDNGTTTLMSPTFDLSAHPEAKISYWRWYSNDQGASPNADTFVVELSNDGGNTWKTVEIVGPAGPGTGGGWFQYEFAVKSVSPPTAGVRIRYKASDLGSGSIVEACIDDFSIVSIECGPACIGDINGDGKTDQADLGMMLATYGLCEGDPGYNAAANLATGTTCPANPSLQVIDQSDLGVLLGDYGCGN